jgi:hypothetical protein
MIETTKPNSRRLSANKRLLVVAALVLLVVAVSLIVAALNPAEVTIWAPGPDWGYATPYDRV